jgi:hypothetical protein
LSQVAVCMYVGSFFKWWFHSIFLCGRVFGSMSLTKDKVGWGQFF